MDFILVQLLQVQTRELFIYHLCIHQFLKAILCLCLKFKMANSTIKSKQIIHSANTSHNADVKYVHNGNLVVFSGILPEKSYNDWSVAHKMPKGLYEVQCGQTSNGLPIYITSGGYLQIRTTTSDTNITVCGSYVSSEWGGG